MKCSSPFMFYRKMNILMSSRDIVIFLLLCIKENKYVSCNNVHANISKGLCKNELLVLIIFL